MEVKDICKDKLCKVVAEFKQAYEIADQLLDDGEYLQAANVLEDAGRKALFDDFQFAIFDAATMGEN